MVGCTQEGLGEAKVQSEGVLDHGEGAHFPQEKGICQLGYEQRHASAHDSVVAIIIIGVIVHVNKSFCKSAGLQSPILFDHFDHFDHF